MNALTIAHTLDGKQALNLLPRMANRHGLIAGATGTGKTVTLRKLAESFSNIGVPVFLVDAKGDLSGMSRPGTADGIVGERMAQLGLDTNYLRGFPVRFWDVYGDSGIPLRLSIDAISGGNTLLLARILNLTEAQERALAVVLRVARDHDWPLIDLRDLRSTVAYVASKAAQYQRTYGNVSPASIGAIQGRLLLLEDEGADRFFGEPTLDLQHWLESRGGQGTINILNAEKLLLRAPRIYGAFLIWFLTRLFDLLPECGDLPQPKLVLFLDEAHLLFKNPSPALLERIENTVRLIRSKGVGVYFVSQNPRDLPEAVLDQLGNRVQHALRAFSANALKNVEAAARTFRANPTLNTVQALTEMGKGEALVSFLDDDGIPRPVQRALIMPPQSRLAPLTDAERVQHYQADPLYPSYRDPSNRPGAHAAIQELVEAEKAEKEAAAAVQNTVAVIILDASNPPGGKPTKPAPSPAAPVPPATAVAMPETPPTVAPVVLVPGQNSPLATAAQLQLRLSWPEAPQFQADVSIFLVGANGKVAGDDDIVFYNQPQTPNGAVRLGNDSIAIDLAAIPPDVAALHITASIDDAAPYRNFGSLGEALLTVQDEKNNTAPLHIPLAAGIGGENTALVFAQIYRRDGQWKIRAIGQGYRDGLLKLCEHYGVAV